MRSVKVPLLPVLALCSLAGPLWAQCSLRTSYRLVTNMSGGTGTAEVHLDSGVVTSGPVVTPGTSSNANSFGCAASVSAVATADYGHLSFVGSGSANNAIGNGVIFRMDEFIGGQPKALFNDRFHVSSSTLPNGTPVVVEFTLELVGGVLIVDSSPLSALSATLRTANGTINLKRTTPGVSVGTINTTVGANVDIVGNLLVTLYANGILGGTPRSATLESDVSASSSIRPLTSGVTLEFCSGASYTRCAPDFDHDGFLTGEDFDAYSDAFVSGNVSADFDADGFVTGDDFDAFVAAFEVGC